MTVRYPKTPYVRFVIAEIGQSEFIFDTYTGKNVFFIAATGFGTSTETIEIAEKVIDFLNSSYAEA